MLSCHNLIFMIIQILINNIKMEWICGRLWDFFALVDCGSCVFVGGAGGDCSGECGCIIIGGAGFELVGALTCGTNFKFSFPIVWGADSW